MSSPWRTGDVSVALGLGSNVGRRARNLSLAAMRLALLEGLQVVRLSAVYETEPWGVTEQPPFLNAVLIARTRLCPEALLDQLKTLERELGRVPGPRWGPRIVDVDIILYGELHVATPQLQIPHPRLCQRQFVLVPLAEVAPEAEVAPGLTASDLARPEDPTIRRLGPLAEVLGLEGSGTLSLKAPPAGGPRCPSR